MTKVDHVAITDEAARFVEAEVAAGRFRSVDDALTAAAEALSDAEGCDAHGLGA